MYIYRIGDLYFKGPEWKCFKNFIYDEDGVTPDCEAVYMPYEPVSNDAVEAVYPQSYFNVLVCKNGGWIYELPDHTMYCHVSKDYRHFVIRQVENDYSDEVRMVQLVRTALECLSIQQGKIAFHSACVEKDGEAVLFTGFSGTGKSTRAQCWVDTLDAQWISGDRPLIDCGKGMVYGVPWDGKEQIFRNVTMKIKGLMVLHRSSYTRIRHLTKKQMRSFLLQQTFIPMWDTETANMAIFNVFRLMKNVPIYQLLCDRTHEAAEESYQLLYHSTEAYYKEEILVKLKQGFTVRNVVGEYIMMPTGENIKNFDGSIILNDVSAFLVKHMQNPITKEDLLGLVLDEYKVDRERAEQDLDKFLETMKSYDMIDMMD